VSPEERFLPVEFISRSLWARDKELKKGLSWGTVNRRGGSYLVEVCAGFWGNGFEDLHILNEQLTGSFDLCQTGAIPPGREESRQGQAISPSRVYSRGICAHTGNLSASDQAAGKNLRIQIRAFPRLWKKTDKYPNVDVTLSSSAARAPGLSV